MQQPHRSSLAEQPTRTSLDLDLQVCRTRQRQLSEDLNALRELKMRLQEPSQSTQGPQSVCGPVDLPHWALRDERFRILLREAHRQVLAHLNTSVLLCGVNSGTDTLDQRWTCICMRTLLC